MSRLRILILGPGCNPEKVSTAFVGYSHAAALAQLHDVTLVTKAVCEGPLRRAGAPFRGIEVVRTPRLDRMFDWGFRTIFKSDYSSQALTAFRYPFLIAFEWLAWRLLRRRIRAGEFDIVLRILPVTAVLPSCFAFFLRKGPVPFVIGPINGGLPWPSGFTQLENQKEWISSLRDLYRFLPFTRSAYKHATAIIAASSQTYSEFEIHREKLFFIPENGISDSLCAEQPHKSEPGAKLKLIFVGGLIPLKACDLALRATAPLLQRDEAQFTVVGDGRERKRLEQLARTLGIENSVRFCGWISHKEVLTLLRSADVLVFPSLREFGGGVVFEALASGAVPIVVDFGGPGDIVHPGVGYKVPLSNESELVAQIQSILEDLVQDREKLNQLRQQGVSYARQSLNWDAKALATTRVLNWALRRGPRPVLAPPKILHIRSAS